MEQEVCVTNENITVGGLVDSVNGQTGDVVLTTSDLENDSDYQTGTEVEEAVAAEATIRANADDALETAINAKQDKLTAGDNITIDNNVISATGGASYTAGDNITISNNVISATDTTYTAGNGLDLTGTEFSADTSVLATQTELAAKANSADLATVATSGSYNDLTNKPTIPTVNDATLTVTQNGTSVGTFTANDADDTTIALTDTTYTAGNGLSLSNGEFSADTSVLATQTDLAGKQDTLTAGTNITITNDTISATDTTYSDFTGTDGTTAGTNGLVPAPAITDANKFLKSDGTWSEAGGGGESYTTLTSANYNYPANNPTSIALWLLPVGMYKVGEAGMTIRANTTAPIDTNAVGTMIFLADCASNKRAIMYSSVYGNVPFKITVVDPSTGSRLDDGYGGQIITQYLVKNNLTTSFSGMYVLDARQGYVLNNKITTLDDKVDTTIINGGTTAPTTSTEGSVGTLYSYVDNGTGYLYICTAVSDSTYTWTQLTTT